MSYALPTTGGYVGQEWMLTASSDLNALSFLFDQWLAGKAFAGPVKVLAVYGGGISAGPPMVDVQPMVNQIDGLGNNYAHGTVPRIAVFRLQCGNGGIICDPVAGDFGDAIISHSDISTVKNTGTIAGPGSRRRNDWADGVYFGGLFGGALTQYIAFTSGGIVIKTTGTFTVSASNCTLDSNGNLAVKGEVTAGSGGGDSVTLQNHKHGTGSPAAGTSVPTAGT